MATRRLARTGSPKLSNESLKDDITVLESKYITMPSEMFTSEFNVLDLEANLLSNVIQLIFKRFLTTLDYKKVSPLALKEFIIDVCDSYNDVPYHNLYHATNVLHYTYVLLEKCDLIEKLNPDVIFGVLIAALVHDIDHPGNNNVFEINTRSELAFKYNDLSVLEQHHCSVSFELIKKHNLTSSYSESEYSLFRKTIITSILGTDMAHHKENTMELSMKTNFNLESINEQILLCKYILHAVDIGNPIYRHELCEQWSKLVCQEFHNQMVKEENLGLKPFMSIDINNEISFLTSEIGFITHICEPYWEKLLKVFPAIQSDYDGIKLNLDIYLRKLEDARSTPFEDIVNYSL